VAARVIARPTRSVVAAVALAAILATIVGCGVGATRSPRATSSAPTGPGAPVSQPIAETRAAIVTALGTVNLILDDADVPFRPAESPAFAAAPRQVFQAVLPDDPGHGYITVYEFPTLAAAAAAAEEQAIYITSGTGRVQFPPDAQFVLRRVGSTVVFHVFSRGSSSDRRGADVVAALQALGDPVPIPR
jgi:hypothetical protein